MIVSNLTQEIFIEFLVFLDALFNFLFPALVSLVLYWLLELKSLVNENDLVEFIVEGSSGLSHNLLSWHVGDILMFNFFRFDTMLSL